MKKIIDFFLSKPFCLIILVVAFFYGLILPWMWGNDPFDAYGTLSILCEDRKIFFWIWTVLIGGGYFFNTNYAYRKYGENSRFLRILTVITFIALCLIALTLKHPVNTFAHNPKRVIHWIATGTYIVCVGLSVFIFLVKNSKKYKGFSILSVLVFLTAISIGVWLAILGKSAMMEMIPNAAMQILLGILNFTPLFKKKELKD